MVSGFAGSFPGAPTLAGKRRREPKPCLVKHVRNALFALIVLGQLGALLAARDSFPFSNYAMYARVFKPRYVLAYQLRAENSAGHVTTVWSQELGLRRYDLFHTVAEWDRAGQWDRLDEFVRQSGEILRGSSRPQLRRLRLVRYTFFWSRVRTAVLQNGQQSICSDPRNFRAEVLSEVEFR